MDACGWFVRFIITVFIFRVVAAFQLFLSASSITAAAPAAMGHERLVPDHQ